MAPLDFLAAFLGGAVTGAAILFTLLVIASMRQRDLAHDIALLLTLFRELRDIGVGILHALQILAGTRPKDAAAQPKQSAKESARAPIDTAPAA